MMEAHAPKDAQKAIQLGRSKQRGDAYFAWYVEPLRAARTTLRGFFSILLIAWGLEVAGRAILPRDR